MNEYSSDEMNKDKLASAREKDRLHYQTILQSHIDRCLCSMGKVSLGDNVQALFYAMYFNVVGLNFKDRLKEKKQALDEEMKNVMKTMALKNPSAWHHPIMHKHMMLKPTKQYNMALFLYCMDLSAEAELLIAAKDFVEKGEQS